MSPHCQVHRTVWLTGDFCLQLCYADGPHGTVTTFQPCPACLPIHGNGGSWGDKQCTLWREMYSEARSDAKWKECDKVSMGALSLPCFPQRPRHSAEPRSTRLSQERNRMQESPWNRTLPAAWKAAWPCAGRKAPFWNAKDPEVIALSLAAYPEWVKEKGGECSNTERAKLAFLEKHLLGH